MQQSVQNWIVCTGANCQPLKKVPQGQSRVVQTQIQRYYQGLKQDGWCPTHQKWNYSTSQDNYHLSRCFLTQTQRNITTPRDVGHPVTDRVCPFQQSSANFEIAKTHNTERQTEKQNDVRPAVNLPVPVVAFRHHAIQGVQCSFQGNVVFWVSWGWRRESHVSWHRDVPIHHWEEFVENGNWNGKDESHDPYGAQNDADSFSTLENASLQWV